MFQSVSSQSTERLLRSSPNDTADLCADTKNASASYPADWRGGWNQGYIREQAAHLGYYLIKNHPFTDGNKRTGMMAMLTFLELNGVHVDCSDEELIQAGFALADGSMDDKQLLQWLINHS